MKFDYKIEGGLALHQGLKALARPGELDEAKLQALIAAGAPIRDEAKLQAPFDEGRLFSAVTMETEQPSPRRVDTRTGVAIWVDEDKFDYRPKAVKTRGGRDYQKGSIPYVYGAFLNFLARFGPAVNWFGRAWDAEGGQAAVTRVSRVLNRRLVTLFKRRMSGR